MAAERKLLGKLLVEQKIVDQLTLERALKKQKEFAKKGDSHKLLGEILVEMGSISEVELLRFFAKLFNTRYEDLKQYEIDIGTVNLLPQGIAKKHNVITIKRNGRRAVVAVGDPYNIYAQEEVREYIDHEWIDDIDVVIAKSEDITRAIDHYYAEISTWEAIDTVRENAGNFLQQGDNVEYDVDDGTSGDDSPIVTLVRTLLVRGFTSSASDIHIEPMEKKTLIRMRIDGMLTEYATAEISSELHRALIARIKIMSSLDITERRLPQDGHFQYRVNRTAFNVRTSVIPCMFGEKVVLRLMDVNKATSYDEYFGMNNENYNRVKAMLDNPNGIVYITGATGSGKTTTLYMMLEYLKQKKVSIASIEDPVERNIERVSQMQVNNLAGLTFEKGLRAILRQDPDIFMVGETRDEETASISIRAAITGHLVLSSIHTNDAVSTITRLIDMKIPPYMVAASLTGVIAQRLVRKICTECGRPYKPTKDELSFINIAPTDDLRRIKKGKGCQYCNSTGYKGRMAVHEVMEMDNTIRRMINRGASMPEIREHCIEKGMIPLEERIKQLVLNGTTTIDEYIRLTSTIGNE